MTFHDQVNDSEVLDDKGPNFLSFYRCTVYWNFTIWFEIYLL